MMTLRAALCSPAFLLCAALCPGTSVAQELIAVSNNQYSDRNISFITGESTTIGNQIGPASGEVEVVDAVGNTQVATIQIAGTGEFTLYSSSPVVLPAMGLTTGPLVDVNSGAPLDSMLMITFVDIQEITYDDLNKDAQNRITDLQSPPIKNVTD